MLNLIPPTNLAIKLSQLSNLRTYPIELDSQNDYSCRKAIKVKFLDTTYQINTEKKKIHNFHISKLIIKSVFLLNYLTIIAWRDQIKNI